MVRPSLLQARSPVLCTGNPPYIYLIYFPADARFAGRPYPTARNSAFRSLKPRIFIRTIGKSLCLFVDKTGVVEKIGPRMNIHFGRGI
jgi:hypothetical protein